MDQKSAKVLPNILKMWLDSTKEDHDPVFHSRTSLKPFDNKRFVAELLDYLQCTILLPQHAHLGHMPYFGALCFLNCLVMFAKLTKRLIDDANEADYDYEREQLALSPFAVCAGKV